MCVLLYYVNKTFIWMGLIVINRLTALFLIRVYTVYIYIYTILTKRQIYIYIININVIF